MSKAMKIAGTSAVILLLCTAVLIASWHYTDPDVALVQTPFPPITGPLQVSSSNPRYFADPGGRIVYLTGSHNWDNLVDRRANPPFDFPRYLDFLQAHNHNFIRLWTRESAAPKPADAARDNYPLPYLRTGPGVAADGGPRFDLTKFDPAYFERLRSRVRQAHDRGIYVMVMLFHGFSIQYKGGNRINPWPGHPYNAANNVNGIDGDLNHNGEGEEVHTLEAPAVTQLQEAYVRKVIDTLSDLDVLYEISNESHRGSTDWQYHMIRFIHDYERLKSRHDPVVMTYMWDGEGSDTTDANLALFASPAEAIAPGPGNRSEYKRDPPPADGGKVILADTDHLWGTGGEDDWAWKSLLRGLNPILMDPLADPGFESLRRTLGQTRAVAANIDLASMTPRPELASSGYCLANPGIEYLVFAPSDAHPLEARVRSLISAMPVLRRHPELAQRVPAFVRLSVEVDLTQASQPLQVSWFNTSTGRFEQGETVMGGRRTRFTAPFAGPLILHLR
jgi:hypothetical protein